MSNVSPKPTVNSQDLKLAVLDYCIFQRDMVAVTEGINGADVLAFTRKNQAIEFEVKVSKSDLAGEIKDILAAHNGIEPVQLSYESLDGLQETSRLLNRQRRSYPKIRKHEMYLNLTFQSTFRRNFIPNYFVLVVTPQLVDFAKEKLTGLPYGLYSTTPSGQLQSIIRMKRMHNQEVESINYRELLRRTVSESYYLRKKLREADLSSASRVEGDVHA